MDRERTVIHLNVADFAVAVERAVDSRLRGRPVIVAPRGAVRAAVHDMSDEAYRAGVRKGMALTRAQRICRDAVVRPPRPARCQQAMADLLKQAIPYSPLVEWGDDDGHLFLDVTGTTRLFGPPMDVAWRMRKGVRRDLGMDPIWSVAPNKLVAKAATRIVKPDGEYIVAGGEEADVLAPLPLSLLPGVERRDLERLRDFNLTRVFETAKLTRDQLAVAVDRRAGFLYEAVRGIDPSPVLPADRKPDREVVDHTFSEDAIDADRLETVLYTLAETAGHRLRRRRRAARTVAVRLDFTDGLSRIRQRSTGPGTADDRALFGAARAALYAAWHRRVRVRHLSLICDRLVFPPAQLSLFSEEEKQTERRDALTAAIDGIRERFGWGAIGFGRRPNPPGPPSLKGKGGDRFWAAGFQDAAAPDDEKVLPLPAPGRGVSPP
jgi:DNA polymerase-4